jgi:hypothetical protein
MSQPSAGRTFEVVSTLCDLPAPGGHEGPVRDCLRDQWGAHAISIEETAVGNLLARVGDGAGSRVLIDAHMDEIAFRVRLITNPKSAATWSATQPRSCAAARSSPAVASPHRAATS